MQDEAIPEQATILLLGNYPPDGQRSMRRFSGLLAEGLRAKGIRAEIWHPPVVAGRAGASGAGVGKWLGYIDKYLLLPFLLRRKLRSLPRPFLVHICDHSNAPYTRWLRRVPHLVTCHDLLAVRSALGEIGQNPVRWTGRRQQAMILRGLRRSRAIASVSKATRDDVLRLVGDRPEWTHVIPNALDAAFLREAEGRDRPGAGTGAPDTPDPGLPSGPYVLHIGGEKWYKNRAAVLRLFARLAAPEENLRLAVIGPRFSERQLRENHCQALAPRIDYLEGIDDERLRATYRRAELLLFPSWIEGFGWPILEAQACGCAAATLDRPPMAELNALPGLRLPGDPRGPDWEAEAARRCLAYLGQSPEAKNEAKARMRAFAAGFTNERAVEMYCRLYRAQLENGSPAHPQDPQ